jgi:hypothetical protein
LVSSSGGSEGGCPVGQVAGLKEQIAALNAGILVFEQRLKLTTEQMAASGRATEELEKQFQLYKEKVSIEGKNASPAKVDAAIVKVANGNTDVRSSLSGAIQNLEYAVYGAIKKLDPETLKRLGDVGKPFVNVDGDKKLQ